MKDARPPEPPAPDVLDRLHQELNDALLERVKQFARRRVRAKRIAGVSCFDTDDEADNMATDAATLTILGHRTWNPEVPLFQHLCGVVRSTSTAEIEHHTRFRRSEVGRLSLDESSGENVQLDATLACQNTARGHRPQQIASLADQRDNLIGYLRLACRGDAQVSMLLDAYESGCEDRADVLDCVPMTESDYRNARRRLDRMIESLPETINDGALDVLEVTYGF